MTFHVHILTAFPPPVYTFLLENSERFMLHSGRHGRRGIGHATVQPNILSREIYEHYLNTDRLPLPLDWHGQYVLGASPLPQRCTSVVPHRPPVSLLPTVLLDQHTTKPLHPLRYPPRAGPQAG